MQLGIGSRRPKGFSQPAPWRYAVSDLLTFFRCACGQVHNGVRIGSRFWCLACGRVWRVSQDGQRWGWGRKRGKV